MHIKEYNLLKIIGISIVFFLATLPVKAQDADTYVVIKVFGDIVNTDTGKRLKHGDSLAIDNKLVFTSSYAKVVLINPQKGRVTLSENSPTGLFDYLPNLDDFNSYSESVNSLIDLQSYFNGSRFFLNDCWIEISPDLFPMDDNSFFYALYSYEGKTISKPMPFSGDSMLVSKDSLYQIENVPIDMSYNPYNPYTELFYNRKGVPVPFAKTELIFVNSLIADEIKIIWQTTARRPYNQRINEVQSYLNEFYGKTERQDVELWISLHE